MKEIKITLIFLFIINFSFSQLDVKEVTKEDSIRFENTIKKSIDSLKLKLNTEDYLNDTDKKFTIEFAIERLFNKLCQSFSFLEKGVNFDNYGRSI